MTQDRIAAGDSVSVALQSGKRRRFGGHVCIVGAGVVGRALGNVLERTGRTVKYHDPAKGLTDGRQSEVAFVCVPTPYDPVDGVDLSAVHDALERMRPGTVAVLRSTVLPGTTETLQAAYPELFLLFCPEFLTEATADRDEQHPARVIVGYTAKSKQHARDVMDMLPSAPFQALLPAREAEAVKYFANAFYALKVAYANQFHDVCNALGVYWGAVQECGLADPMMAPYHTEVKHGGYRGFGGKCLPKDTKAIVLAARDAGVPMTVLEAALLYNGELSQGR
jgi:UDPglucose 6-dehydrogenase